MKKLLIIFAVSIVFYVLSLDNVFGYEARNSNDETANTSDTAWAVSEMSATANYITSDRPAVLEAPLSIITAYTLAEDETDGSPTIGAYNDDLEALRAKGIQVCASNKYPRGTKLKVGHLTCEVYDRMNARYQNRIDLLMGSKEEAFEWGIKKLSVERI